MERLKLKERHPVQQKLQKLIAYAEELGLTIEIPVTHLPVTVYDKESEKSFTLEDADSQAPIREFPPVCEYKVFYQQV
jgi:hypothetical protein